MGLVKRLASLVKITESDYPGLDMRWSTIVNYAIDSYFTKMRSMDVPVERCPDIREMWLECELHKFVNLSKTFPAYGKNQTAYAFAKLFHPFGGPSAKYSVVPFLDKYPGKEEIKHKFMVHQESIRISPDESMTLPVSGIFFVFDRSNARKRAIVEIDFCFNSMGCGVTVMTAPGDAFLAEQFMQDLTASRMANNIHYRQMCGVKQGVVDFCNVDTTKWEDVIVKPHVREMVSRNTSGILNNIDAFNTLGMSPSRNVLLISPPGMAKTMIFRATAGELVNKCTILWCTGKSIESASNVTAIFDAARELAPCVVMIEDMDLFGGDRSMGIASGNWILNEFLACLDGMQSNPGVVVMASTNDVASMDEALVNRPGRFDVKVEMPLPDKDDRHQMIHSFLGQHCACFDESVTPEIFDHVLEATDGMTGAYIKDLVKCAIINAVNAGRCDMHDKKVDICHADITSAVDQILNNFRIGNQARKHHVVQ